MVVAAHPDDEVLGLGATMHRLIHKYNAQTHVVILGEGLTSRSEDRDTDKWKEKLKVHRSNIRDAQEKIGYGSVNFYDFPDNQFDTVALLDIIKVVEKEKEAFRPEVIFTHHGGDVNIDHQRTFESVVTACRPMEDEVVKTILTYETPSGTEWIASTDPRQFTPNVFIEVKEESIQAKCEAMECYEFEKREYPHPRSPESLKIRAKYWGLTTGYQYAEPYCLIRSVLI